MADNIITIGEYFDKGIFVVPNYQRGYKWAVPIKDKEKNIIKDEKGKNKTQVAVLMDNLITAFKTVNKGNNNTYFLQGVTVSQNDDKILLIDGQQRTTTLFLLLFHLGLKKKLLLKGGLIKLNYEIRKETQDFLQNLIEPIGNEKERKNLQDIYYLQEASKIILEKISCIKEDLELFVEFILHQVTLLYINIAEDKATKTFTMMNGNQAKMMDEELIKSEFLRLISLPDNNSIVEPSTTNEALTLANEIFAKEWDVNANRSKYAREWDKWLYWWNQPEVNKYFGIGNQHPLHYLLRTYFNENKTELTFNFENFKTEFIPNNKDTIRHFEEIRKLQKKFEDLYFEIETYNLLGLTFNSRLKKDDIIKYFIINIKNKYKLNAFTKFAILDCTLDEIQSENREKFEERKLNLRINLSVHNLYDSDSKGQAYLQLLRMNIFDMPNRKFDFDTFKTKSLEHICPQNPNENDTEFIKSMEDINNNSDSIHSIGNLVLLNGSANSKLSRKPLNKKKLELFNLIKEGFLLPHTLKVFSKSFSSTNEEKSLFDNEKYWVAKDVLDNKAYFFLEFDKYYDEYKSY